MDTVDILKSNETRVEKRNLMQRNKRAPAIGKTTGSKDSQINILDSLAAEDEISKLKVSKRVIC